MKLRVNEPTNIRGHTLDVITQDTDTCNTVSMVEVTDPGQSDGLGKVSRDHLAVIFISYASRPAPLRKI